MTTDDLRINSQRLKTDFDELAEIGATRSGGVSRVALSDEDLKARAWFADKIEEAGLEVRDDDVGNLSGLLRSPNPAARTLLIGSHLDSVPNGGKYDGALGVLSGLECLRTIKEAGLALPVHLEVINFTDDEGNWHGLFGSMGLTGQLSATDINDATEDHGPFRAALFRTGIRPSDVAKARRDPKSLVGYLELHIEQGYRLERAGLNIGLVHAIVGRTTYQITFHGEAAHAGTTFIQDRHDALRGAAEFIVQTYARIPQKYPEGLFNCGSVEVHPGAFNVVPESAHLMVEVRHPDTTVLLDMETLLVEIAKECAALYYLDVTTARVIHRAAAAMSGPMLKLAEAVCKRLDLSCTRLVSYSGHDAQMLANFTPSLMIFIPSVAGISHSPKEFSHWHDVEAGANVLLHTALAAAGQE